MNATFKPSAHFIPFSPPWLGSEEERALLDALRSGWITTGPKTKEFEQRIARYVGVRYGVGTFSCTDAMQLALRVCGLQEGDEVITTPYTFASTGHVVCYHRAKPVFVDVEADTFNIDPQKIEEAITSRTRAILPVHFAGHPCDMDRIMEVAERYKLHVVEDAAHAIGAEYNGRKIGSIGDITCFSFYATKNLTTAEGGMAVTDHENWARQMRVLTMYGISDAREVWHKRYQEAGSIHYDISELGYKCNMTDLCAALGLCQLDKLDQGNLLREEYAQIYNKAFEGHPSLCIPVIKGYAKTSRHLYPLLLNLNFLRVGRDTFVDALKEINVKASVLFKPLHLHSYYANLLSHRCGDFPVAEDLFERSLCLPISPGLGKEAIEKVAESVLYLVERFKR
jgi:dTDP-4-amino-4,6-dideoxygalactose transaminase